MREAPPQFPVDAHNGCGPTTSHRCLLTRRRVFHMMGVRPCTGAPKSAARVPPRLAARLAKSGRVPPQSEAGGVVDANALVRAAVFVQQSVPAVCCLPRVVPAINLTLWGCLHDRCSCSKSNNPSSSSGSGSSSIKWRPANSTLSPFPRMLHRRRSTWRLFGPCSWRCHVCGRSRRRRPVRWAAGSRKRGRRYIYVTHPDCALRC